MKHITFITGNKNKAEQLSRYLGFTVSHKRLDLPEIQSMDLAEIATEKAKAAYEILGSPVFVEDTSLSFSALNGLPGPLIKWFFESIGNIGLAKLLDGYSNRDATAETCFAFCDENGVQLFFGECKGTVPKSPQGDFDFGWNPIFIPEGEEVSWAQMTPEQSAKTSMRRRAIEKMQSYLEQQYRT